jgi:hypothetical protein
MDGMKDCNKDRAGVIVSLNLFFTYPITLTACLPFARWRMFVFQFTWHSPTYHTLQHGEQ